MFDTKVDEGVKVNVGLCLTVEEVGELHEERAHVGLEIEHLELPILQEVDKCMIIIFIITTIGTNLNDKSILPIHIYGSI